MPRRQILWIASTLLVGCASATPSSRTPDSSRPGDQPVAASVPRKDLPFRVDLRPAADCEEAFDLAVYPTRGIDLLEWDDGRGCRGRRLNVRYLPDRIQATTVNQLVRKHALHATPEKTPE